MISKQSWQGVTVYTLHNSQLSASLCPELGCNLYSIRDHAEDRELLRAPSTPEELREQPIQFGTPILMPPNRIRGGHFEFAGRAYRFEPLNQFGHHSHGLFRNRPWQVTETGENGASCYMTCELHTASFPDIQHVYPHDLHLSLTYELEGGTLTHRLTVTNRGQEAAPFGYGLHTWFMLDGEPEAWTLQLPSEQIWELDAHHIPTGIRHPLGDLEQLNAPGGLSLKGLDLDTVFQIGAASRTATLSRGSLELRYTASDLFKQWVIYTKGTADQYICLEPYTWVTNAPNLNDSPDVTGFRAIEAGESLQLDVSLEMEHK
ncbi:aldose 1-epimerase [Paenibacillus sp. y28]|uniref:aldose 1-epimerase n=1 Tax=Paenibacillus sp. y28 TaxID=3129110 RepID=UPI003019DDEC